MRVARAITGRPLSSTKLAGSARGNKGSSCSTWIVGCKAPSRVLPLA